MTKRFQLRKHLAQDTESYDRDPIEKYIDYLREQDRIVEVGNLLFDAEALMTPFVCDTRLCIPEAGAKRKGKTQRHSCCIAYRPRMSKNERTRINKILSATRERFPTLDRLIESKGEFYAWDDSYDCMVAEGRKGFCIFLTPDTREFGFHACMLHAYCLEQSLSPCRHKPSACVMFPLFLLDREEGDGMLVTVHSEEVMLLGEKDDDNYVEVGCCKPNSLAKAPIYIEMKDTLLYMFGAQAWGLLDRALRRRAAQ